MIDPVALAQALVRIDSRNPPGDEQPCVDLLAPLLRDAGFEIEIAGFGPERVNLIARRGTGKARVFTGHLDVVPLGAAPWTVDPFGGEIIDGKLFGRGATDMKAGVAAMIAAAIATPDATVTLILTGGEETGSEGAQALAASGLPDEAEFLVVGEPTDNRLLAGHKGALWLKGCCHGVTAHGSTPHLGTNAVYAAARAVGALERFGFGHPAHPIMGNPSLNVGTMSGGLNINSVPDRAEFTIDIRTVPGQHHDAVTRDVANAVGAETELATLVDLPSVWSDPQGQTMMALVHAHGLVLGAASAPASANYFTDASVLTPALGGVPTVICGPGDPAMAHKTDEFCEIAAIHEAVAIYRAMLALP